MSSWQIWVDMSSWGMELSRLWRLPMCKRQEDQRHQHLLRVFAISCPSWDRFDRLRWVAMLVGSVERKGPMVTGSYTSLVVWWFDVVYILCWILLILFYFFLCFHVCFQLEYFWRQSGWAHRFEEKLPWSSDLPWSCAVPPRIHVSSTLPSSDRLPTRSDVIADSPTTTACCFNSCPGGCHSDGWHRTHQWFGGHWWAPKSFRTAKCSVVASTADFVSHRCCSRRHRICRSVVTWWRLLRTSPCEGLVPVWSSSSTRTAPRHRGQET